MTIRPARLLLLGALAGLLPGAPATAQTAKSGWRLQLERTIDAPDGSPGEIGVIDGLAIDDAGRVYAMQRKPARVLVFDAKGNYARTIGRDGDGPGDVRNGYLGLFGDTLAVQQPQARRLALFRLDGTFLSVQPSFCCHHIEQLTRDSLGRYWVPGPVYRDGDVQKAWLRLDRRLAVIDTVFMPVDSTIPNALTWKTTVTVNDRQMERGLTVPLSPRDFNVPLRSGLIMAGRSDRPELLLHDASGGVRRRIPLPLRPIPTTRGQRDSIAKAVILREAKRTLPPNASRIDWSKVVTGELVPAVWPVVTDLATDLRGRIWVGTTNNRGLMGRLLVLDGSGKLLGEATTADPRLFEGYWGKDHVVVPGEDEDGRPVIKVYRIVQG